MSLRRTAQLVLSIVLLLAAAGCVGRGGGGANGSFRAADVVGSVVARFPGAEARALHKGDDVPAGSVLKTASDAYVQLEGGDGELVELQADTQVTLVDGSHATLEIGKALGVTGEDRPFTVESRGTAVRVAAGGATRVERLLGALRVAVYRGSARVELLGRGLDVPGLREIVIAGGVPLEREARPLTLSATDRWDRRLLGDVLDFDQELTQFGTGFNSEFGGKAIAPAFFTTFVALPSLAFLRSQVPTSEPSEVLVGVVFAQQLSARSGGPAQLPNLFAQMLDLRNQGASWGLIAKEKGLDLRLALQGVLDAIRRGTAPPQGAGTGGGGGSGGGSGGGGGGSTPGPKPSPSPTASPSEPPPEEPPPGEECSLLETLLGTCPEASTAGGDPAPADECSVVGVLIDPNC